MVRKKTAEINKLKKMVKETKEQDGSFNFNQDYYDEFIYRMDKNEIRNLD